MSRCWCDWETHQNCTMSKMQAEKHLHPSSTLGHFPSAWKSGNINALYKHDAKIDLLHYRPKSLLPIISNVMESIIKVDIKSFLCSNALISDHQLRFKLGHSHLDKPLLLSCLCHPRQPPHIPYWLPPLSSQCLALNEIPSSPLPAKAGVPPKCLGHSPNPNLRQWSFWLSGKSSLSLCWWLHPLP